MAPTRITLHTSSHFTLLLLIQWYIWKLRLGLWQSHRQCLVIHCAPGPAQGPAHRAQTREQVILKESSRRDSFHPINYFLGLEPFPHLILFPALLCHQVQGWGRLSRRQTRGVWTDVWADTIVEGGKCQRGLLRGCRCWQWRLQEARREDGRSTDGLLG